MTGKGRTLAMKITGGTVLAMLTIPLWMFLTS
jgi:hypothetical protein